MKAIRDLNASEGDVVRCVRSPSKFYTVGKEYVIGGEDDVGVLVCDDESRSLGLFTVVRRASDQPRTWGELTDEEKGALLLAHHEGKVIECLSLKIPNDDWDALDEPTWYDGIAYRVQPEPVRETEIVAVSLPAGDYVITFETVNGKPDPDTIRMEPIR